METNELCPICGAHLANWLEVFGWEHRCEIPVESSQQEAALKGE